MSAAESVTTTFRNPPLHEVVFGVAFKPLEQLRVPHYGSYWQRIRQRFPTIQEVNPLPPIRPEEAPPNAPIEISALPRIWFKSKDENDVIQVQQDRFLCNWRKVRPEDSYPRFGVVKETFFSQWSEWITFLTENQLGTPDILQLELTYANHIPQSPGRSLAETAQSTLNFPMWTTTDQALERPDRFLWRTVYKLPAQRATLQITVNTTKRPRDAHPVIALEFSFRGKSRASSKESLAEWFDSGHTSIVSSFVSLTNEEVQRTVWEKAV